MTDRQRPDPGPRPAASPALAAALAPAPTPAPTRAPAPAHTQADASGPGALLRAARQQQGIHIAALAASMKVPPARLEALEAGRYQELVDTTFTRALAQAMCRALRIDPAPVLAQLPGASPDALGRVDGGLNTPFREHGARGLPADWAPWRRPMLWLAALLLVAAAAFVLVPAGALRDVGLPMPAAGPVLPPDGAASAVAGVLVTPLPLPAGATDAAAALSAAPPLIGPGAPAGLADAAGAAGAAVPGPASPSLSAAAAAGPASAGPGGTAVLQVRALRDTWVQAVDARNQTLLARLVPAGQAVDLSPEMPVRLRIGNVAGTELILRGQPVDLSAGKRDNMLSLSLQ